MASSTMKTAPPPRTRSSQQLGTTSAVRGRTAPGSLAPIARPIPRPPPRHRPQEADQRREEQLARSTPASLADGSMPSLRIGESRSKRPSTRIVPAAGPPSPVWLTESTTSLSDPIAGQSTVLLDQAPFGWIARGILWTPAAPLISMAAAICRAGSGALGLDCHPYEVDVLGVAVARETISRRRRRPHPAGS